MLRGSKVRNKSSNNNHNNNNNNRTDINNVLVYSDVGYAHVTVGAWATYCHDLGHF